MKVSEIKFADIKNYLRLSEVSVEDTKLLNNLLIVAINYIKDYTGIPISPKNEGDKTLDDYQDFYIAVLILVQDMYDNRTLYVDNTNMNRTVETILSMHSMNLL
jgi:hypothetical protein